MHHRPMPFAITYIVQSFHKQGKKLVADQPHKMKTAESAVTGARRLVDKKAGVVAYSVGHDPEVDLTEEPKILFKAGQLPPELAGED